MSKTTAEVHPFMREAISDLACQSVPVTGLPHKLLYSEPCANRGATNVSLLAARVISFLLVVLVGCDSSAPKRIPPVSTSTTKGITSAEDEAILRRLCTQCHLYVEPSVLPIKEWEAAIPRMAQMPGYGRTIPRRLETTAIVQWFRERAPETLAFADRSALPIQTPPLERTSLRQPPSKDFPFVSQVRIVTHPETKERSLLTSDMHSGWICEAKMSSDPLAPLSLRLLSDQCSHAVRTQSVDLDGDGRMELLASNLGSFAAMDHNLGSVDWLRPAESGFDKVVLADNFGRVADIKPFDFDGDGDLDLAVAEFGWRLSGHVLLLENTTRKGGSSRTPQFTPRTLDERHGAVQVEVTDIDGNGRPDVIALLAQEHEMLVAYLNLPDGSFKARELFRAPHSVWGYSGFQLLDFDGDQDLDVLITNGDMMDGPTIKPFHSVAWLENVGEMKFVEHTLAELPGAHRAEAADLDGDGDFDIVACMLVPSEADRQAERQGSKLPPALVWLEQTEPLKFQLHVWERGPGRYATLTTGDFDGDGKTDVVLGVGRWQKPEASEEHTGDVELWLSGGK
ncbi:MAG: VCBS repeat-containing protein [Planctomycetia bacterium]|nr:VCBS repeat-containing protein [Planctomycetia bacterium]